MGGSLTRAGSGTLIPDVLHLLTLCSLPRSRRPSGVPEKDLRSTTVPYLLQQRDALRRRVQKQEAENRQLAEAVLAGRRQVEELQLQGQAQWQAWQVSALALPSGPCPLSREESRPRGVRCGDTLGPLLKMGSCSGEAQSKWPKHQPATNTCQESGEGLPSTPCGVLA